jgi:Ino eighty subunit 2
MRESKNGTLATEGSNAATSTEDAAATYEEPMDPLYTRWVSNSAGSRVAVPEEWLAGPIGEIFAFSGSSDSRKTQDGSEKKDVEMTSEAPKLVREVA